MFSVCTEESLPWRLPAATVLEMIYKIAVCRVVSTCPIVTPYYPVKEDIVSLTIW